MIMVLRARSARIAGTLRTGALVSAMAAAGCVPIPIHETAYIPDPADVTPVRTNSGCAFNEASTLGMRKVGAIDVRISLRQMDGGGSATQAILGLGVLQRSRSGRFQRISFDPRRIKLLEDGRTVTARMSDVKTYKVRDGTGANTSAMMTFPAPSTVSASLRIDFESGAIKADGRPVPMAPVRFDRKDSPMVYMFPCIPA